MQENKIKQIIIIWIVKNGKLKNKTFQSQNSPQKNIVQGKSKNDNKLKNVSKANLGFINHKPET